ncbi:uncharacterized protein LOC9641707 [Selaginella moellendorffii]|uniref:uncharacterized protein LOC9641707 n=1 Tax=Selaginella moellendorffii TaxID=88036 RepID=UPI000D1CFA41|nr:uncharacterized protein LOC9641707 [Selaginella moellendorffii]|eukprot:XP_024524855.1 uncharacterized protein LOC9641707 [Selaginella moellendorffii]
MEISLCYGGNAWARRGSLVRCAASRDGKSGLLSWMRSAAPHEILGLSAARGFGLDDVKAAFRSKVKEYHPDVYRGAEDPEAITQCLIRAYEELSLETKPSIGQKRRSLDPFQEPEGEANDIFVNELLCIGKGCPYSCVERAPSVFRYNPETGRAQAVVQGRSGDYSVQLAVGQCPRNCIHYVTEEQGKVLRDLLHRASIDPYNSNDFTTIQGLIARAAYENGRYRGPKRKPKRSDKMVDYY